MTVLGKPPKNRKKGPNIYRSKEASPQCEGANRREKLRMPV